MHPLIRRCFAPFFLTAVAAFAQTPSFTIVDTTNLNASLGNAGKGVLEAQALGFTGVAFGNNIFVAVASTTRDTNIRWATSPDGVTWTPRSVAIPTNGGTGGTSKIHFIGNQFLFFATLSDSGNFGDTWLYRSADGLTWTATKVIDGALGIVEFDGEGTKIVAAGSNGRQIATSDLVTWTSRPVVPNAGGFDHNDLAYGAGKFFSSVNGFGGTTYVSSDTVTWTNITSANVVGGSLVETGNGLIIINANPNLYRSSDGVTFTKFTATAPGTWLAPGGSPRFSAGRFLATSVELSTGKVGYMTSPDAQTWSVLAYYPLPAAVPAGQSRLWFHTDMVIGNGKMVIVGQDNAQTISTRVTLPLVMVLDVGAAPTVPVPPVVTAQPLATSAVIGRSATLSVTATGSGNTYQWRKDNVALQGATSATYTIASVTQASAGSYSVVITNSAGNVTSSAVTLSLVPAEQAGRLINLSVLTDIAAANENFTLGYVVGGAGTSGQKPLVIRAAGPSLSVFSVAGPLDDPKLETFSGSTSTGTNDNWGGSAPLTAALTAVGAFAFTAPTSKDAAISTTITSRDNSVVVSAVGTATGKVLAEVYDATPSASFTATTPRLLNVSVRKALGGGVATGFVLGGSTPTKVLIRVVGPGLAQFGVSGTVVDPQLVLFNSASVKIGENNDWGGSADLTAAFTSVGAFALPSAASKDAALLVSLPPGNYSVQASGVNNTTGVALVEVYEVP